jgi:hypothetical protein
MPIEVNRTVLQGPYYAPHNVPDERGILAIVAIRQSGAFVCRATVADSAREEARNQVSLMAGNSEMRCFGFVSVPYGADAKRALHRVLG